MFYSTTSNEAYSALKRALPMRVENIGRTLIFAAVYDYVVVHLDFSIPRFHKRDNLRLTLPQEEIPIWGAMIRLNLC